MQFEHALYRMVSTRMIANTDFPTVKDMASNQKPSFDVPVTKNKRSLFSRAVLDIANPIDPIDRSIMILNQVVAMERDEALHRPR